MTPICPAILEDERPDPEDAALLVSLAFFLGSDYTDGVTGVGIVNAMEILHAFPIAVRDACCADEDSCGLLAAPRCPETCWGFILANCDLTIEIA